MRPGLPLLAYASKELSAGEVELAEPVAPDHACRAFCYPSLAPAKDMEIYIQARRAAWATLHACTLDTLLCSCEMSAPQGFWLQG